jgi:hypothetical protein
MVTTSRVRGALADALARRGHDVRSDTHASGGPLYLAGENDLALALFEVHPSAQQAMEAMYQGAWIDGLPTRFAVLPRGARAESAFELLEQMRIVPLLYDAGGDEIEFPYLDGLLERHL